MIDVIKSRGAIASSKDASAMAKIAAIMLLSASAMGCVESQGPTRDLTVPGPVEAVPALSPPPYQPYYSQGMPLGQPQFPYQAPYVPPVPGYLPQAMPYHLPKNPAINQVDVEPMTVPADYPFNGNELITPQAMIGACKESYHETKGNSSLWSADCNGTTITRQAFCDKPMREVPGGFYCPVIGTGVVTVHSYQNMQTPR